MDRVRMTLHGRGTGLGRRLLRRPQPSRLSVVRLLVSLGIALVASLGLQLSEAQPTAPAPKGSAAATSTPYDEPAPAPTSAPTAPPPKAPTAPAPTSAPTTAPPKAPAAPPPSTPTAAPAKPPAAPPPTTMAANAPATPEPTSPSATAAGAEEEPKQVSEATKQEARRHFQRGIKLLGEQAWAPALAEFLLSRQLYPTRVATNNAAFVLRRLERYDEALEMYENLLRDFETVEVEKQSALEQVAELRSLVGTIDVIGAEPGAFIVIANQDRGVYPPVKPLRVAAGTHVVRVFKEGFEAFEKRVDVAGGETATVNAKLVKLKESGRLRVTEKTGKQLDVLVDNVTVGKTPWEGTIGVGNHQIMLRGEGKLGTQPTAATVRTRETTALALLAEELDASLRVDPTPPGANVAINGVEVGHGVWLGRLKVGPHKVEVSADGFLTATRDVTLERGQRQVLAIELDRDDEAPMWRIPPKWTVDLGASFLVVPTFAGDVAGGCDDACERPVGMGFLGLLHGSYELGSGVGFGLEAGYLIATQEVRNRSGSLRPNGTATPTPGLLDDDLRLQGFLGGATIGYHAGSEWPVTLQLGAGIMVGEMRDERSGSFAAQRGGTFDAYPLADFQTATYFYLDPGIRAGFRFAEHFELSASVQALMLIGISTPTWDDSIELAAGSDGVATYADEEMMGGFVMMVAPGLNLRYDY